MIKQRELLTWTPEMVENFWDYESQFSENYFSHEHGGALVRDIQPFLGESRRVLDYGCGPGYMIEKLLKCGFEAAGLDSSVESRQVVDSRFNGQDGFLGAFDWDELVKSELRFDAVTVIEVIEHLYDPWLDELLERLRAVVRPSGVLIITTPNEEDLAKNYILSPDTNRLFHRWQHVRSWSKSTLEHYLNQRGFSMVSCYATNFKASFHTDAKNKKRADAWSLYKKMKYRVKGRKKRPHLIAVARPRSGAPSAGVSAR